VATGADPNHLVLTDLPDPQLWDPESRPRFLGPASEPKANGSCVSTQFS